LHLGQEKQPNPRCAHGGLDLVSKKAKRSKEHIKVGSANKPKTARGPAGLNLLAFYFTYSASEALAASWFIVGYP